MSNLPAKPEFSRTASAWPDPNDDRRPSGPGRASPDRYSHQRDDRDRNRDARDRERGNRSRYTPNGQRSPVPPRSVDRYIASSRDTYHGREYRGYDDTRVRDDRRNDWDRDRDKGRDRDRDRGYYRRDSWNRRDYSPNRPTSSRREYGPRESDWRSRDNYRRERNRERGRSWDRERDKRPASPTYRPAPFSPRRDRHHEPHSLSRRAQPLYPSRKRRSTSPQSVGSRSRRSSPSSHARPEPADIHQRRDIPRPLKSPSPRRESPSTNRSLSECRSPETAGRSLRHVDEPHREAVPSESEPVRGEDGTVTLDGQMEVEMTAESVIKGVEDRFDNRDGELPGKAEPYGRTGSQQQLTPILETVAVPSSEAAVTQPYLPIIPRYDPKPKFSATYEGEYNRLEAHRAHAAAECRRCSKASRRAFHELEMTTMDLRAAQNRRELGEAHRKKAHHGQLGIDAETVQ